MTFHSIASAMVVSLARRGAVACSMGTLGIVTGLGRLLAQKHWLSDVVASWFPWLAVVARLLVVLGPGGRSRALLPPTVYPGSGRGWRRVRAQPRDTQGNWRSTSESVFGGRNRRNR